MNIQDRRNYRRCGKNRLMSHVRKKYLYFIFLSFIALYFPHFLKYMHRTTTNFYPNEDFVALKYGLLVLDSWWRSSKEALLRVLWLHVRINLVIKETCVKTCVVERKSKIKASTGSACPFFFSFQFIKNPSKWLLSIIFSHLVESAMKNPTLFYFSQASIRLTGSTVNLYKNNSYPT